MGKKELSLKSYLSDPARYADVYNGNVFGGMQVLRAEQLEKAESVQTKSDGGISLERICDLHEECRHLDVETYEVIGKLIGTSRLQQQAAKKESEEEQDMCKAIEDLIEDGRVEGFIESCKDFGLAEKDILAKLQQKLNMTAQKAQEYLDMFEKQCI